VALLHLLVIVAVIVPVALVVDVDLVVVEHPDRAEVHIRLEIQARKRAGRHLVVELGVDAVRAEPGDPDVSRRRIGVGGDADAFGHRDHHLAHAEIGADVHDGPRPPLELAQVDREAAYAELVAVCGQRIDRGRPVLALADAVAEADVGGRHRAQRDREDHGGSNQPAGSAPEGRQRQEHADRGDHPGDCHAVSGRAGPGAEQRRAHRQAEEQQAKDDLADDSGKRGVAGVAQQEIKARADREQDEWWAEEPAAARTIAPSPAEIERAQ
jgi:hypothetical protein